MLMETSFDKNQKKIQMRARENLLFAASHVAATPAAVDARTLLVLVLDRSGTHRRRHTSAGDRRNRCPAPLPPRIPAPLKPKWPIRLPAFIPPRLRALHTGYDGLMHGWDELAARCRRRAMRCSSRLSSRRAASISRDCACC